MEPAKKPANAIRVRYNSRIRGIINYSQRLLKENNLRELTFSAVGGSIGTLVTTVEILKTLYPGIHQVNRFATISYQSVEEGKKEEVQNQRLFPKLEVKLSLDKPAELGEGYQEPISEDERKKIVEFQNKRRQGRPVRRGPPRRGFMNRPRRGFRGGFRGRRNPPRGRGRPPVRGQPASGNRARGVRGNRGVRGGRGRGAK
jgi:hypothetical protein